MDVVVGVGDMKMSTAEEDILVTYNLGSCLGVAVYDSVAKVGGLIHVMLPKASMSTRRTSHNAFTFVDTGVPLLIKLACLAGAQKERLKVYLAGGASFHCGPTDLFAIGKKNLKEIHSVIIKEGIDIQGMEIGGHVARTLHLEMKTGRAWLNSCGKSREL